MTFRKAVLTFVLMLSVLGIYAPAQGTTPQTISGLKNPGNMVYNATGYAASTGVSASSGLAVSYSSTGPINCVTTSVTRCTPTGVGAASVTASQAGDATHAPATPVTVSFNITPAALTFTGATLVKHQGEVNPPLVYRVTGYVGSDSAANSFSGGTGPVVSTTATDTSAYGTYPITLDISGLSSRNYTLAARPGTLQVIDQDGIGANLNNDVYRPDDALPHWKDLANRIGLTIHGDGVHDDTLAIQSVLEMQLSPNPTQLHSCSVVSNDLACATVAPHGFVVNNYIQVTASSNRTINREFNSPTPAICKLTAVTRYTFSCTLTRSISDTTSTGGYVSGARINGGSYFRQGQYFAVDDGVYLVSNKLNAFGCCVTLEGNGPYRSVIQLADESPAFRTGTNTPVFYMPGVLGNQGFRLNILNMGIHIGAGNPNAEALFYVGNNTATLENVVLWNDDAQAVYGLYFGSYANGPMLNKNVAVYGFKTSVYMAQSEYHTTAENITLEGYSVKGVALAAQPISWRHVLTSGSGPAFAVSSGSLALVDSELMNGSATGTAVTNAENAAAYLSNVTTTGYQNALVDNATGAPVTFAGGTVTESWSGPAQALFPTTPAGLHLPINETPTPTLPVASTWCKLGPDPSTWQAVMNSCTSGILYAAGETDQNAANTTHDITIPATITYINLYDRVGDPSTAFIHFIIQDTSTTPLIIERTGYNAVHVSHNGSRTVVFRHGTLYYEAAAGAGDVYFEDVEIGGLPVAGTHYQNGVVFQPRQHIWARQFDDELYPGTYTSGSKVVNQGATLWILGYKTEGTGIAMLTNGGGQTEILGCLIYPVSTQTQPAIMFRSVDSNVGYYSCRESVHESFAYDNPLVDETRNGTHLQLQPTATGVSQSLPFYYSKQ